MRKLKRYLESKGLIKKRFAERIGMTGQQLSNILDGTKPIPKKFWRKIIQETDNEITMNDLLEYFLGESEETKD